MKKYYTEIGIGNDTFINTETEYPDGSETRASGFVKMKLTEVYIRIWLGKKVFILSSKDGFKIQTKGKAKLKVLLGFAGV